MIKISELKKQLADLTEKQMEEDMKEASYHLLHALEIYKRNNVSSDGVMKIVNETLNIKENRFEKMTIYTCSRHPPSTYPHNYSASLKECPHCECFYDTVL